MEYKITPANKNYGIAIFGLVHNGLDIAHICFSEIERGYRYFENDLSEEEYYNIFIEDKYLYIEEVYVDKNWRKKGIANKLMNEYFKYCYKKLPQYNQFVLIACPLELSISIFLLKLFYNKFGFTELIDYKNTCLMLK